MKQYNLSTLILNGILLLAVIAIVESKINNNMFDAKIFVNKQMPISRLEAAGHRFSIPATDSNYEIIGDVYESQTISEQKQIYNLSFYRKSESCTYFKSILQMNSLKGQNLNYIALQSLISQDTQELYIIGMSDEFQTSERFLKMYTYTSQNFQFQSQVSFNESSLSQDIDVDILMTKIDNSTLFSDGNFLYRLQPNTDENKGSSYFKWVRVQGWSSSTNTWKGDQFLGFKTIVFQEKQLLLFFYSEKVILYEYNENKNTVNKYLEIENNGQDAFEDVEIGFNNSNIFILAGNQLLHYSLPDYKTPVKHQLAGQLCTRIYIYLSTVHIICEYEKRNFIGEYFYNETLNVLILNRFYNDIQNYRLLSYINNYFLMVGENDIILTSNGVNRKVLLDMPKNAYSERFVSFGIQNILILNQFEQSDFGKVLFAVGEDFVVLFELKFVPAEVWCYIQRPPQNLQKNILIVRNTSKCEMNEKRQTLKSICINLKPVQIFFQHYEIQSKVTSIFVIIAVLLIFVLAFLCLGCVFRENMNYNHLMVQIKKKIKKLNKKEGHQMRQL